MGIECCKLVGNLDLALDGCIISISTSFTTDVGAVCGDTPLEGPSIASVNITAYASFEPWVGCPSRAGVSIPFIRKYDCLNDLVYFIFNGQGQSFYTGDANQFVTLKNEMQTTSRFLSASSQGGPAGLYTDTIQHNGYGLIYDGSPISFDTSADGTAANLGNITDGKTSYLQNFSLDLSPTQLPVVTYSFVYSLGEV
jgi:hypothetical protein